MASQHPVVQWLLLQSCRASALLVIVATICSVFALAAWVLQPYIPWGQAILARAEMFAGVSALLSAATSITLCFISAFCKWEPPEFLPVCLVVSFVPCTVAMLLPAIANS